MRPIVLLGLAACSFTPGRWSAQSDATDVRDADALADADANALADATVDVPVDAATVVVVDAPPDAALTWVAVETITVACSGQTIASSTTLLSTGMYRLRATGTCTVNTSNGSLADADYFGWNIGTTYDTFSGTDNGIAVDDNTPGASKLPQWGTYTNTHVYEVPWTGGNATIALTYHDSNYSNNSGSLTVQILSYQ